jgi:hypothetical protein
MMVKAKIKKLVISGRSIYIKKPFFAKITIFKTTAAAWHLKVTPTLSLQETGAIMAFFILASSRVPLWRSVGRRATFRTNINRLV